MNQFYNLVNNNVGFYVSINVLPYLLVLTGYSITFAKCFGCFLSDDQSDTVEISKQLRTLHIRINKLLRMFSYCTIDVKKYLEVIFRILAFCPYISYSTSAFKELKIPMLKDLYTIQLYKILYKNIHNILPVYFQRLLPNYNNGSTRNHNLRHQDLRLPMTRKEYYVQSTKYQLFKLIRETPQLDLDRCLTSYLVQFVAYFKYKIIEAYNAVCNIRNCYICQ